MESIKSYLSVIDPRLLRHINGKTGEFLRIFQAKPYLDEAAFMAAMCTGKHSKKYYQNLKSKAIHMLQALAFISPPKGRSEVKKKFSICQKKFLIGQKFIAEKDQNEGVRLIRQGYKIAVDFQFTHMACEMANILYKHHIYYQPNPKKARSYAKDMHQHLQNYVLDKQAEDIYLDIIIGKKKSDASRISSAIASLEGLQGDQERTIRYTLYFNILKVLQGFNGNSYGHVITACQNALNGFEGKKGVYSAHYQYFHSKMGLAYMALRAYDKGDAALERATQFAPAHSFNEYILHLYKTINALQSGRYSQAYVLFRKHSKRCKYAPIKRHFAVIEAYFCFLAHYGLLRLDHKFRLGKYLNEQILHRDQASGDNIPILIAELLVLLVRDKGGFIDRVEAIKTYSLRHLRGPEHTRAKLFLKILCQLPRANFHPQALQTRCKAVIDTLYATSLHIGNTTILTEIIPFHALLELIIDNISKKAA